MLRSAYISERDKFFQAETRDGVIVDEHLKKVWKVMLDMFEEFVRVCDKYGLKYCLDGGSVLGAVRHGGFIPWDDDMDISLSRDDFNVLIKVAPNEFKHPYFFQYTTTDPQHIRPYACLRNSNTSAVDPFWAERGVLFNMGIGIDIFPFDEIPESEKLQRGILSVNNVFSHIFSYMVVENKCRFWRVKQTVSRMIAGIIGFHRLISWRDRNFSRYNGTGSRLRSNFVMNLGNKKGIFDKSVFEGRVKTTFEYLDVWIPSGYEEYLKTLYGENWRIPIRGKGDHGSLVVEVDKPYIDVLVDQFGYDRNRFKTAKKDSR